MATLIQPINIDGTDYCCSVDGCRRTPALLDGDARESAEHEWTLLEAVGSPPDYDSGRPYEGSVKFGICCGKKLTLTITGRIETKDNEFDWLRITLNPGKPGETELYYRESEEPEGDPDDPEDTESIGPLEVIHDLEERPCGHIILIESSTGDSSANNDIWWKVKAEIS